MTEERELRIPFDDLTRIAFECPCGAEVTLNFIQEEHRGKDWQHKDLRCPICNHQFPTEMKLAFDSFGDWYDRAINAKHKIYFRLTKPQ